MPGPIIDRIIRLTIALSSLIQELTGPIYANIGEGKETSKSALIWAIHVCYNNWLLTKQKFNSVEWLIIKFFHPYRFHQVIIERIFSRNVQVYMYYHNIIDSAIVNRDFVCFKNNFIFAFFVFCLLIKLQTHDVAQSVCAYSSVPVVQRFTV